MKINERGASSIEFGWLLALIMLLSVGNFKKGGDELSETFKLAAVAFAGGEVHSATSNGGDNNSNGNYNDNGGGTTNTVDVMR